MKKKNSGSAQRVMRENTRWLQRGKAQRRSIGAWSGKRNAMWVERMEKRGKTAMVRLRTIFTREREGGEKKNGGRKRTERTFAVIRRDLAGGGGEECL